MWSISRSTKSALFCTSAVCSISSRPLACECYQQEYTYLKVLLNIWWLQYKIIDLQQLIIFHNLSDGAISMSSQILTSQVLSSVKISSLTTSILFHARANFSWFIASFLLATNNTTLAFMSTTTTNNILHCANNMLHCTNNMLDCVDVLFWLKVTNTMHPSYIQYRCLNLFFSDVKQSQRWEFLIYGYLINIRAADLSW